MYQGASTLCRQLISLNKRVGRFVLVKQRMILIFLSRARTDSVYFHCVCLLFLEVF